jgi:hypothetical protein
VDIAIHCGIARFEGLGGKQREPIEASTGGQGEGGKLAYGQLFWKLH